MRIYGPFTNSICAREFLSFLLQTMFCRDVNFSVWRFCRNAFNNRNEEKKAWKKYPTHISLFLSK